MGGTTYVAIGALILLLLPVVVLPWEGRRVPDGLYAAVALGGLAAAGFKGGFPAFGAAAAAGLGTLALVAVLATALRILLNLQLLTSGHIKLLAAGATWLGFAGTGMMIGIALAALFAAAVYQHRRAEARRPDFAAIAALAILCVSIQQIVPDREPAAASAATK